MKRSIIDLSAKRVQPYTLIFLKFDGHVLLMKRNATKNSMPGRWLGLGGKVERNEDLLEAGKREFLEESGLVLSDARIKGTFAWIDETNVIGITHIIVATAYTGTLEKVHAEGVLQWHPISDLESLDGLAEYQRLFLNQVFSEEPTFYSGMGVFHNGEIVSLASSFTS